jgi:hypothetical protein
MEAAFPRDKRATRFRGYPARTIASDDAINSHLIMIRQTRRPAGSIPR